METIPKINNGTNLKRCIKCGEYIGDTKDLTHEILHLNDDIDSLKKELEIVSSLPDNNYVAIIGENNGKIEEIWVSNKMQNTLGEDNLKNELKISKLQYYINESREKPGETIHADICIHKLYINIMYNEETGYFNLYFIPSKRHKSFFIDKISDVFGGMLDMADQRDPETGEHLKRLSILSGFLAEKLGQSEDFIENMTFTAPLHDIGKVGIPDSILLKKGKLTTDEFEIMKTHTTKGDKLLYHLEKKYGKQDIITFARNITLYHHEKYDGSGYPEGKIGENIPLEARILAIIDVFDALKSKRPYKEPFSDEKTIKIIKEGLGNHFDPEIVEVFLENWDELLKLRSMNEDK